MTDTQAHIDWFYSENGQQGGPISEAELRERAATGRLAPSALVWCAGMAEWKPAGSVPGLFEATAPSPPRMAPPPMPAPMPLGYAGSPPPGYGYPPPAGGGQDAGMRWILPVGRSGWAIAAGYLGLFSFIILPAPLAVIISLIAIRDIRTHPGRHGMGRAVFGLVAGLLGTIVLCLMIASGAFASRRY